MTEIRLNSLGLNSLGLPSKPEDTRVVVAMSGGVDSSVVAGMLAGEGYDVVGITLQLYDHGAAIHRKGACCAGQDIHDARRVAESLGIPHYVMNYEKRFLDSVIDKFADSYIAGETPIPCVTCNQTVKFEDLLRVAKELGASALATGHYIQSRAIGEGEDAHWGMFRPVDSERDQSYFLFATTQDQLDYLRFPLGGKTKAETRDLAREMGLAIAEKSDSQDICFVPNGNYAEIIKKLRPNAVNEGNIVHMDGRVLGTHSGIINFTIGQRRGLGIATGEPLYVVRLDADSAKVVVGPHEALVTRTIYLRDVNWLGGVPDVDVLADGLSVAVKIRSTRGPQDAIVRLSDGATEVELLDGEHGVSPGQACVFYTDSSQTSQVLGGGWIERTLSIEDAA